MSIAKKIWSKDEAKPVGAHNTSAPAHWFEEDVVYAAELFGLEKEEGTHEVHILDEDDREWVFRVVVERRLCAIVYPSPKPNAS